MRALALALTLALVVTGCVAPERETPAAVSQIDARPIVDDDSHNALPPPRAAPIPLAIRSDAARWIEDGTTIQMTLATPLPPTTTIVWAMGPATFTDVPPNPDVRIPDTGSSSPAKFLQPGQSSTLQFPTSGTWRMLCEAQHDMASNVTVLERYQGPSRVDVDMYDDHFAPENVTIPPRGFVVYHNRGSEPHTATGQQVGPQGLTALALPRDGGALTVRGAGWTTIRAIASDASGAIGGASLDVYVAPIPTFATQKIPFDFTSTQDAPLVAKLENKWPTTTNGTITLSYVAQDPVSAANGGATPSLALVTVKLDGPALAKAVASEKKAQDKMTAQLGWGAWTITIVPEQGAKITGTVTVDVAFDLTPPPEQ